jgi:hypothetical protein
VVGQEAITAPSWAPILDEDPINEIITELNVLAEVKLPARRSKFSASIHKTRSPELRQEWTWSLSKAVDELELPSFAVMVRCFLYDQLYPDSDIPSNLLATTAYPAFNGNIAIFMLLWPLFVHQVIAMVLMGCVVNSFGQHHLGEEDRLDMIASL